MCSLQKRRLKKPLKASLGLLFLAGSPAFAADFTMPPTPKKLATQATLAAMLNDLHDRAPERVKESQIDGAVVHTVMDSGSAVSCGTTAGDTVNFNCEIMGADALRAKTTDETSTQSVLFAEMRDQADFQHRQKERRQPLRAVLPVNTYDSFAEHGFGIFDDKLSFACFQTKETPASYYCQAQEIKAP